ncbi:MAG: hypothetical protein ACK520_06990, partial [Inhella sp.]
MIFDSLSLKQRVALQVALNLGLQAYIVVGVLLGWSALWLIGGSLLIGGLMLWLYLDSASGTGRFVETLMAGAERMGHGDLTDDVPEFGNPTTRAGLGTMQGLQ